MRNYLVQVFILCLPSAVLAQPTSSLTAMIGAGGACYKLKSGWTPQWSHLVGYWTLAESYGATSVTDSSSIATNTGVPQSGTTLGVPGRVGTTAALFDGSTGYIGVPASSTLNFGSSAGGSGLTFSAWIKLAAYNTSLVNYVIDQRSGPNNVIFGVVGSYGHPPGQIVFGSGASGQTTLQLAKWYFIAAVINGSSITYYVNGRADGTASTTWTSSSTYTLQIGGHTGYAYWTSGTIAEAAVWNTALLAKEIKTIYDQQSCGLN